MSVDLIVYLTRSAMPTPERWQQAIREAGFPVELDTDFEVDSFSGFLPCQFQGDAAGFEYFADQVSEADRAAVQAPVGCDFSVTLVTHSDFRELACSLAAAGALCQISGGLLVDADSGESYPSDQGLEWVREQFAELEPHLQ